jgi:Transposase, Mutator family
VAGCNKMRNLLEKIGKRDYEAMKSEAQAIYRAESRREVQAAFHRFPTHWREAYPTLVKQWEKDLPELLSFFGLAASLMEKAAHPLWHSTLLCGGAATDPKDGLFGQRGQRGSHYLFDL